MAKLERVRLMDIKKTVTFRIKTETKRRIEQAARKAGTNMSQYVEQAVEARLDREKPKPDFRKRFGAPQMERGPSTNFVELFLKERHREEQE